MEEARKCNFSALFEDSQGQEMQKYCCVRVCVSYFDSFV
jgi:hypothetical protein